jgi:putative membrane protein
MQNFLIRLVVNALALSAAAWLLSGITLSGGFFDVMLVALIFGLLNALLKPILLFFSLPFLIVTLGLFAFVVNAVVLLITASLSSALTVDGFVSALLGSLVISIVTILLGSLNDEVKR